MGGKPQKTTVKDRRLKENKNIPPWGPVRPTKAEIARLNKLAVEQKPTAS